MRDWFPHPFWRLTPTWPKGFLQFPLYKYFKPLLSSTLRTGISICNFFVGQINHTQTIGFPACNFLNSNRVCELPHKCSSNWKDLRLLYTSSIHLWYLEKFLCYFKNNLPCLSYFSFCDINSIHWEYFVPHFQAFLHSITSCMYLGHI